MNHDSEKWLDDRISEDVNRMADKRIDELMNSEELKDIEATEDQLQNIRRRLGLIDAEDENDVEIAEELTPEVAVDRNVEPVAASNDAGNTVEIHAAETDTASESAKKSRHPRVRLRAALAAALVAILVLGVGMVGSGKKVYLPVVSQREDGDESTTKVNNNDEKIDSAYTEEEVCKEIEDQLGVLPVRFAYRPQGMELETYWIKTDDKEATLQYIYNEKQLYVYISKDSTEASINFKVDGEKEKTIQIESMAMTIPVYRYQDSDGNMYFQTSFEYLNTYYSVSAMLEESEFIKIIENIIIKNV